MSVSFLPGTCYLLRMFRMDKECFPRVHSMEEDQKVGAKTVIHSGAESNAHREPLRVRSPEPG